MANYCELPAHTLENFPDPVLDIRDEGAGTVVLAGGCFWCTEAVYRALDGVQKVESGYTGGHPSRANYEAVCTGLTGHAEAIRITYDPDKITLGRILKVFFAVAHDPTQLNRQGNDVGTQYRSAFFYANETQKSIAKAYIAQLNGSLLFEQPIVTTLEPLQEFFVAEAKHQDFAARNPDQPYVRFAALPKVDKLKKYFSRWIKS
jgi:peptide-methionine (S)-S-oxide reductase